MRSLLFCLIACLMFAHTLFAADDVLMFGDGIEVEQLDLDILFEIGPIPAQLKVLKDKQRVLQLLKDTYLVKALAKEAEERGLTKDIKLQARLRRQHDKFLYTELIKQIDQQPVPDFEQAAKEHYMANPKAYTIPEKVQAKHILIATTDRMPVYHSREEASELIKKVKEELDEGALFDSLVKAYSEDVVTNRNNGSLGVLTQGQMVEPIDKAIFSMTKPGEISDIVESKFGFHIIQLDKRFPERKLPFEQEKVKIIEEMKKDFIADRRATFLNDFLKKKKASIYEDLVEEYIENRLRMISVEQE